MPTRRLASLAVLKSAAVIAAIAFIVTGCASTPQPPLAENVRAGLKRVAVISTTGKTFTRQYTGLTVFNNEKEEIDVTDWRIDEQYEEELRGVLEKEFGVTVVRAPYPVTEFLHVNDLNGAWDAPVNWGPNWDKITAVTQSYCTANALDGLLVLARSKTSDYIAGTNQSFGGIGIYGRGPAKTSAVLHLVAKLGLLDCKTGKPLMVRYFATDQEYFTQRAAPLATLPPELGTTPIASWTTDQRQLIRDEIRGLPFVAVRSTLRSLFAPPAR
jgi:hypothetical protein